MRCTNFPCVQSKTCSPSLFQIEYVSHLESFKMVITSMCQFQCFSKKWFSGIWLIEKVTSLREYWVMPSQKKTTLPWPSLQSFKVTGQKAPPWYRLRSFSFFMSGMKPEPEADQIISCQFSQIIVLSEVVLHMDRGHTSEQMAMPFTSFKQCE